MQHWGGGVGGERRLWNPPGDGVKVEDIDAYSLQVSANVASLPWFSNFYGKPNSQTFVESRDLTQTGQES
jgi:hypothetical protein